MFVATNVAPGDVAFPVFSCAHCPRSNLEYPLLRENSVCNAKGPANVAVVALNRFAKQVAFDHGFDLLTLER